MSDIFADELGGGGVLIRAPEIGNALIMWPNGQHVLYELDKNAWWPISRWKEKPRQREAPKVKASPELLRALTALLPKEKENQRKGGRER